MSLNQPQSLHRLYFFLQVLLKRISVKRRLLGQIDHNAADLVYFCHSLPYGNVEDMPAFRPVLRKKMKVPPGHVDTIHVIREIHTHQRSTYVLVKMYGVRPEHLPRIINCTDMVGGLTEEAARDLGLAVGTPVFGGGGDATFVNIGAGCTRPGDTHIYVGTSGWVSTFLDYQTVDLGASITGVLSAKRGFFNYYAELETAGKCFEWVMNHLALDEIGVYLQKTEVTDSLEGTYKSLYEYLSSEVSKVPPGANGVLFTPWLHGNRCPFEDSKAAGIFFNIKVCVAGLVAEFFQKCRIVLPHIAARDDADTILVTNNDPRDNVVVMSQRDYESLMETVRIYENTYLYDKLRRSMEQARSGDVSIHDIVEDGDNKGVDRRCLGGLRLVAEPGQEDAQAHKQAHQRDRPQSVRGIGQTRAA